MVSIPCNYCLAARLPKLPLHTSPFPYPLSSFLLPTLSPHSLYHSQFRKLSPTLQPLKSSSADSDRIRTLFPGGFKRPEINVPTLVLRVSSGEVEERSAEIGNAVSRGVGIVVLDGGEEGGGRVYESACALKPVVGDRAYFLIMERVDVASAIGAGGVVLSDDGIPAIVARNMMMKSKSDSIYLPLVARVVQNLNSAKTASSSEGADFLIINTDISNFSKVLEDSVSQPVKVPIFFALKDVTSSESPSNITSKLLNSGASGLVISLADMRNFTDEFLKKSFKKTHSVDKILLDGWAFSSISKSTKDQIAGFTNLGEAETKLIERERVLLQEAVAVIRRAVPTVII